MRRQPPWLEGGLGKSLYLTTYFAGIVMGNLGHVFVTKNPYNRTLLLGASGGICGFSLSGQLQMATCNSEECPNRRIFRLNLHDLSPLWIIEDNTGIIIML